MALHAAGGEHGTRGGMVDGVGLGGMVWDCGPNKQTAQQTPRKAGPAGNADRNGLTRLGKQTCHACQTCHGKTSRAFLMGPYGNRKKVCRTVLL